MNTSYIIIGFFILTMTVLTIVLLAKKKTGYANIFTMWGMLGTFVGLLYGLWDFDANNIASSVPELLNGMKFAFVTSIAGMIFSLGYTWWQGCNESDIESTNIEEQLLIMNASLREIAETNSLLCKSIGNNDTTSLIKEIMSLKSNINNNHEYSMKQLENFAETIGQASTEVIIEALQDVVKNFNDKIINQFGEHFTNLNNAVKELVVWQGEYKEYLEGFKENLNYSKLAIDVNCDSINSLTKQLDLIEKSTKNIPHNLKFFQEILEMQKNELDEIAKTLLAFSEIRENAIQVLPEVQTYLNQITKTLEEKFSIMSSTLSESIRTQKNMLTDSLQNSIARNEESKEQYMKSFFDIQQALEEDLESKMTTMSSNLSESIAIHQSMLKEFLESSIRKIKEEKDLYMDSLLAMQQQLETDTKTVQINLQSMMEQIFKTSDEQMKQEIQNTITLMGTELTSISSKLAKDYKASTSQLAIIVKELQQREHHE